ncbi:hypothetical protein [Levilactobacillus enshiensis]|uniref:hypothetical protein n=1 Tax=Levilactobacillus enshiensis TaxID=2590213 RepID=UPI00117ABEEB|nr:hypothetical protein [Levilactobacillus enshiensis]
MRSERSLVVYYDFGCGVAIVLLALLFRATFLEQMLNGVIILGLLVYSWRDFMIARRKVNRFSWYLRVTSIWLAVAFLIGAIVSHLL